MRVGEHVMAIVVPSGAHAAISRRIDEDDVDV